MTFQVWQIHLLLVWNRNHLERGLCNTFLQDTLCVVNSILQKPDFFWIIPSSATLSLSFVQGKVSICQLHYPNSLGFDPLLFHNIEMRVGNFFHEKGISLLSHSNMQYSCKIWFILSIFEYDSNQLLLPKYI